ncbi:MAG: hypothetical protein ACRC5N_02995, partial [Plesiomonas sp.]
MAPILCVFSRVNRASWLSLLLVFSLFCGSTVTAAPNFSSGSFELPQSEELQTQLDGLAKKDKLSPTQTTQKTELEQTIGFLDVIDKEKSKISEIQQQYDKAPAQLRQL